MKIQFELTPMVFIFIIVGLLGVAAIVAFLWFIISQAMAFFKLLGF